MLQYFKFYFPTVNSSKMSIGPNQDLWNETPGYCNVVSKTDFYRKTPKEQCIDGLGRNVYDDAKGCPYHECFNSISQTECKSLAAADKDWDASWLTESDASQCKIGEYSTSGGRCFGVSDGHYFKDGIKTKEQCVDPTGKSLWDESVGKCPMMGCRKFTQQQCEQVDIKGMMYTWYPADQIKQGTGCTEANI